MAGRPWQPPAVRRIPDRLPPTSRAGPAGDDCEAQEQWRFRKRRGETKRAENSSGHRIVDGNEGWPAGWRHVDGGHDTGVCTRNVRSGTQRGDGRRRRQVRSRRQHAQDPLHRDLPRPPRCEDREAGRRVLQHHLHVQRHPRVQGHRSAGAGRGPRFRQDEDGLWRQRRIVERTEDLAARLDRDRHWSRERVQRHEGRVGCPAQHGRQRRRCRRNHALQAHEHRTEERAGLEARATPCCCSTMRKATPGS